MCQLFIPDAVLFLREIRAKEAIMTSDTRFEEIGIAAILALFRPKNPLAVIAIDRLITDLASVDIGGVDALKSIVHKGSVVRIFTMI